LSPPTFLKIGWLFAFCVEIGEIVEAEVNMRYETCLKLKIVLTLAVGGYPIEGAKEWLKKRGQGIGESTYYKYSRIFVDLPLEELTSLCGERLITSQLEVMWSPLEVRAHRVRHGRLMEWLLQNKTAYLELREECEAKAEELLKALKRWKHGEKEANGF
jgi:hypothetical protein